MHWNKDELRNAVKKLEGVARQQREQARDLRRGVQPLDMQAYATKLKADADAAMDAAQELRQFIEAA